MAIDENLRKSEAILEELNRRRQKEIVDVEEQKVKLVIFSLLNDYFAFHGEDIKEILTYHNVYPVPGAPAYIIGIINNRGDIESVISLNRLLGFPDSGKSPKSRIAIASRGAVRSGILVDCIEDVIDVPIKSIKPPLSTLDGQKKDFVSGETIYKGKNVTIFNIGSIFGNMK